MLNVGDCEDLSDGEVCRFIKYQEVDGLPLSEVQSQIIDMLGDELDKVQVCGSLMTLTDIYGNVEELHLGMFVILFDDNIYVLLQEGEFLNCMEVIDE